MQISSLRPGSVRLRAHESLKSVTDTRHFAFSEQHKKSFRDSRANSHASQAQRAQKTETSICQRENEATPASDDL